DTIAIQVLLPRIGDPWAVAREIGDTVVVVVGIHAIGDAIAVRVEKPLVDRPVAVVVDAVAGLRGRCARDALLRGPAAAVVHRPRAGPDTAGRGPQSVVHAAVTVVVDAVTGFGGRQARRAGLWDATDATGDRARAGADAARRAPEVLVHAAVTVVIDPVADL